MMVKGTDCLLLVSNESLTDRETLQHNCMLVNHMVMVCTSASVCCELSLIAIAIY